MFLPRFQFVAILLLTSFVKGYAQQDMLLMAGKNEPASIFDRLIADSSLSELKHSMGAALKKGDKLKAGICLQQMGHICYRLAHFPQAMDYHLQADKIFRVQGQFLLLAENLNDIGIIFLHNDQPDLAKQQYEEAFAIYRSAGNKQGMAASYGKIGHLFVMLHQYDSGFYYQRLALNEYELLGDKTGMARMNGELGNIYEDLEKYDTARIYFEQARTLSLQTGDTTIYIEALNNLGDIFRKTGHYQQALPLTRQALNLSLLSNELFHLGSAYRDMAKTYHLLGNNDSAYYFQRIGQAYVQQMYSRENSTQLAILKTLYDVEKKNNEIIRLKATRKVTVAIVVIVVLLLVLGGLVISRQRLRIKNDRLLNEQEKQAHQTRQAMMELQEQTLKQDLELRSKELSSFTLHIMQKNQFLDKLHVQVDDMLKDDRRDQRKQLKQLQLQIHQHFNQDSHWEEFRSIFDQVHQAFFLKLKNHCDTLTRSELRIVALLKMNLTSADMATLLGISEDSIRVMRYRLRKKLNLPQGESLTMFIQSL
jgi:tetratricopeptide (TPR) repeat protein